MLRPTFFYGHLDEDQRAAFAALSRDVELVVVDAKLRPGQPAETWQERTLNDGSISKYGFGWELDEYQGIKTVSHDGSWLAFRSAYIKFPTQKLTVVVLFNRDYDLPDNDPYGVGFTIADIFLEY